MTAPRIPTEEDFLAEPRKEPISSPRDFVDEAVADGLIKDGDTRSVFERTYVPVRQRGAPAPGQPAKAPTKNTTWLSDRAWVDVQIVLLRLTTLTCHVDEWEEANDKYLHVLHEKGEQWSGLYNELACDAVGDARENARSSRYL